MPEKKTKYPHYTIIHCSQKEHQNAYQILMCAHSLPKFMFPLLFSLIILFFHVLKIPAILTSKKRFPKGISFHLLPPSHTKRQKVIPVLNTFRNIFFFFCPIIILCCFSSYSRVLLFLYCTIEQNRGEEYPMCNSFIFPLFSVKLHITLQINV